MVHSWHRCQTSPRSVSAPRIEDEFAQRVLGCIVLDDGWKEAVLRLLASEGPAPDNAIEIRRIDVALANLRKQHLWGAVAGQEFKNGFRDLQRQRRSLTPKPAARTAPNLEQAAKMLQDLPAL